jgi:hypothetical protein
MRSEIEKMTKNGKLVRFLADQNQQGPHQETLSPRNDNGRQNEQRERQHVPKQHGPRNQEVIAEIR